MGAMTGTPHGVAVGALVGGISGAISGGTEIFKARDDAFKSYYGELYSSAVERHAAELESGSGIASGRETDLISFSTLFGSRETAKTYLSELVNMANTTPFLYDDLTAMSKTLATFGYDAKSILPVLSTIGDAGAALGMSTSDMTTVAPVSYTHLDVYKRQSTTGGPPLLPARSLQKIPWWRRSWARTRSICCEVRA